MGDARSLDRMYLFQFDLPSPILEQWDTGTEQYVHDVKIDFIDQPGFQILLADVRSTVQHDVLFPCDGPGFFKGAFNAICNENIGRSTLFDDRFPGFMRKHKAGSVKG